MEGIQGEQIDHVHVHVSDREHAAAWYSTVLGLRKDGRLAAWAENPDGPLMLRTASGNTCIALFRDAGDGRAPGRTIAFRIDGPGFMAFVSALPELQLSDGDGGPLGAADVVKSEICWEFWRLGSALSGPCRGRRRPRSRDRAPA